MPTKLLYRELHQKIGEIEVLYMYLMKEIDESQIIEAIRTIIHFIIERKDQKYNQHDQVWKRSYTLAKAYQFDYLSHLSGLYVTRELYISKEVDSMNKFFKQLLEEHTHLRKDPHYVQYSFEFIFSLIRTEKGFKLEETNRPAIKALLSTLNDYLQKLSNKNAEEMNYWMKCSKILTNFL